MPGTMLSELQRNKEPSQVCCARHVKPRTPLQQVAQNLSGIFFLNRVLRVFFKIGSHSGQARKKNLDGGMESLVLYCRLIGFVLVCPLKPLTVK